MTIKRHCQFLVCKRKKDEAHGYVRYFVRWAGEMLTLNAGYAVEPDKWSLETQRCKNNTTHGTKRTPSSTINRAIGEMERAMDAAFAYFEASDKIPTKEQLKTEFLKRSGAKIKTKSDLSFFEVFDRFLESQTLEQQWERGTRQKFKQLRNDLYDYNKHLTFNSLDKERLLGFVLFLRDDKEFRNSTILKKITFLKWFLNWSTAEGYNSNMAYKAYRPSLKNVPKAVIFLEWEELMAVWELKGLSEPLAQTRDVFCFCCFTGLRYSDVANLKRANVFPNYIQVTTIKTIDNLIIELNDYSREILDRYKDADLAKGKALPVVANQKMNLNLKKVCQLAGLDKPTQITYYKADERIEEIHPKYELITTHAGRRTFICNALALGINPETIMQWTGHSDYDAMKPYIAVADKTKAKAMTLFNKR
ncbi:MAG: tyrosine-type recombinase/integrase [Porphyromonadaceae bacterium]|nr:tyrosine-type recombinase/integrase [Porphyromonadaceae bacterium]